MLPHRFGKVILISDLSYFFKDPPNVRRAAMRVQLAVAEGLLHIRTASVVRRGRLMACRRRALPADKTVFRAAMGCSLAACVGQASPEGGASHPHRNDARRDSAHRTVPRGVSRALPVPDHARGCEAGCRGRHRWRRAPLLGRSATISPGRRLLRGSRPQIRGYDDRGFDAFPADRMDRLRGRDGACTG